MVDDASRLNRSSAEVWEIPENTKDAEEQLRELLRNARESGRKVSIAGARHTMGGHTIYPGGIFIDMLPFNSLELDETNRLLRAGAGARWFEIIPPLDAKRLSIIVMQANSDFTVGGSISANCHGWQYGKPPIASTVESFRIMLADGEVKQCSRKENQELFTLALGGYGLFGVILSVELKVTTNSLYRVERQVLSANDYIGNLQSAEQMEPAPAMVYGRLSVARDNFLEEAVLNIYRPYGEAVPGLPVASPGFIRFKRAIFRGSSGEDYGKLLRWKAETYLQQHLDHAMSRNALLSERSDWFANRFTNSTDVLIETFVPPEKLTNYLNEIRAIIPRHNLDLLNLTVRHVSKDEDTFLKYADREMVATVMLFQQSISDDAEKAMREGTREIIDAALKHSGRYYLPYRLHASREQFHQAYPRAREFFALKKKYDPEELFQNQFYLQYGRDKSSSEKN